MTVTALVASPPAPGPPRKHCRLGGSAASIYLNCTKAPELWQGRKKFPSPYAEEGTRAHEVIEALQKGDRLKAKALSDDTEMLSHAQDFVDHCNALRPLATSMVEEHVDLEDLWLDRNETPPEPLYGTVDFGALSHDHRTLIALDFKYGKGVPVYVENNPQLMFYALGVYYRLRRTLSSNITDRITTVQLGVYAPRQGDTEPRWWTLDLIDLLEWGESILRPAVEVIHNQLGSFNTGSHCRFCVGAPICPELYKTAITVAKNDFPDDLTTPLDVVTSRLTPPTDLSDDELGEALSRGEILSTWLNAVRAETSSRLARGRNVAGWKHVAKKAYRQWKDEDQTTRALVRLGLTPKEIMTTPELKSPAQIEKTLRVRKLDPKVVNPLTETPVTGVTLVPSSHPAPALLTSAGSAFPEVNDD